MLKIDLRNMLTPKLEKGLSEQDLINLQPKLDEVAQKFQTDKTNFGFAKLPNQYAELSNDLKSADELMQDRDTIVVIGIGGSDLGTRAIFKALKHHFYNQLEQGEKLYFAGDTTDPDELSSVVDILNFEKTLFFVVSKSGNTIEQASVFVYLRKLVLEKLGEGSDLKHFAFLTDSTTGTLRELATKSGYKTISIPTDVGGRFSVLSSVGMVPMHLIGVNVENILKGAADLDSALATNEEFKKEFLRLVGLHYLYYKAGKNISVLMPYKYSLSEFAKWFRQLWAESLGKRLDLNGNEVFEGITPIAALGPTDQHSQLQLYNEGPNDKIFTFISVESSARNLDLPADYQNIEAFDFFKGHNFQELLSLQQQSTAYALTKNQRPNATLTIPQVDEYHIGQLLYFFEVALVHLGMLLNVDSFDQPGVELSKNVMYGILGKAGYEEVKTDFQNFQNN